MDWIYLDTKTVDSPAFQSAEPVEQATWLKLLRWCVGQENSGRIGGARGFSERTWLKLAGVTLTEVEQVCALWSWRGEDLLVAFYPLDKEELIKRNRALGSKGGKTRAVNQQRNQIPSEFQAPASSVNQAPASSEFQATAWPDGSSISEPSANPTASTEKSRVEENRVEGGGSAPALDQEPHIPTWQEFVAAFVVDGIPEEWLERQFDWFEENRSWLAPHGQLKDWRRIVRRRWSQDRATWKPSGAPSGNGLEKKSAASPAQQLYAVDKQLAEVRARLQQAHELDVLPLRADVELEKVLEKKRRELEGGNS